MRSITTNHVKKKNVDMLTFMIHNTVNSRIKIASFYQIPHYYHVHYCGCRWLDKCDYVIIKTKNKFACK